jgi:enoyl-CoA hydratase/carnithine racemase
MPDYQTILVDISEGVATLTLNRPERANSINPTLENEFIDAMWALDTDDAVRVVVLTGAGRIFCGGADISAGDAVFGEAARHQYETAMGVDADGLPDRYAFWRMHTPIIAAINGSAAGAGITLPLLCDIRLVAEEAKLAFVFTKRGMLAEANSTWLLPRLIGVSRAMELLLSGRIFTGREAAEIGLASRALPADEVLPAALELGHQIADLTAPTAVAVTKNMVYRGLEELDRNASMALEMKLAWWLGTQPDVLEGVASFLEKRPPQWAGSKHTEPPKDLEIW